MFSSRLVLAGDLVNNMENKHLLVLHISVQKCHISHLSNSKEAIYSSADLKTTEEELKLMFEFLLELQVNLTETRVQLSRPPESETLSDKLSPDQISPDWISPGPVVLWFIISCGSHQAVSSVTQFSLFCCFRSSFITPSGPSSSSSPPSSLLQRLQEFQRWWPDRYVNTEPPGHLGKSTQCDSVSNVD